MVGKLTPSCKAASRSLSNVSVFGSEFPFLGIGTKSYSQRGTRSISCPPLAGATPMEPRSIELHHYARNNSIYYTCKFFLDRLFRGSKWVKQLPSSSPSCSVFRQRCPLPERILCRLVRYGIRNTGPTASRDHSACHDHFAA